MKSFKLIQCCLVMGVTFASSPMVIAQTSTEYGGIGLTVSATESMDLKPEKLRLTMKIQAQGKDAKAAIVALAKHKERTLQELESMKASKDSIAFSGTQVGSDQGDQEQAQMRGMQMQMMRSNGRNQSPSPPPTVFTASCYLRAEWPLPVQEGDALALLPANLKEQLVSRDIAGDKNKPELSPQEQERMEELAAFIEENYGGYYGSSEAEKPSIMFVAPVGDATVKTLVAKAFGTASAQAKLLSDATGVKLGRLQSLSHYSSTQEMSNAYYNYYNTGRETTPASLADDENWVTAASADDLRVSISVNLSYALE
ncbi:MAG: SIMPL domain-containing protein [Pirellulaceae bacterium]